MLRSAVLRHVLLIVVDCWLFASCSTAPIEPAPTASLVTPEPTPPLRLSLLDAAQQAVDMLACHDVSGHPSVLVARDAHPAELLSLGLRVSPALGEDSPLALVVVGGNFNLLGFGPGASGWSSRVGFVYDMRNLYPHLSVSYVDDRVLQGEAGDELPVVQPSHGCRHLPEPSRSPRLAQNCRARPHAVVPQVCGSVGPLRDRAVLELRDDGFMPDDISLPNRTTVTWVNHGLHYHTLAGPGWIDPVEMEPGDIWTVTYDGPGTFDYRCTIHPEMHLRLVITQP